MSDRYSLNRADKKIAGVCSTLGDIFNIDPTFLRIGLVALAVLVSWEMALIGYFGGALYLAAQRRKANRASRGESEFERMGSAPRRTSIHELRTTLDSTDRRLMAIDHHIAKQKDHELAREIEALREDK